MTLQHLQPLNQPINRTPSTLRGHGQEQQELRIQVQEQLNQAVMGAKNERARCGGGVFNLHGC